MIINSIIFFQNYIVSIYHKRTTIIINYMVIVVVVVVIVIKSINHSCHITLLQYMSPAWVVTNPSSFKLSSYPTEFCTFFTFFCMWKDLHPTLSLWLKRIDGVWRVCGRCRLLYRVFRLSLILLILLSLLSWSWLNSKMEK